jgi:hypothetical protein
MREIVRIIVYLAALAVGFKVYLLVWPKIGKRAGRLSENQSGYLQWTIILAVTMVVALVASELIYRWTGVSWW